MGIISEELPEHLQLKAEGSLSFPDWPSIYGTIWAGIKALYAMLEDLKAYMFKENEELKAHMLKENTLLKEEIVAIKKKYEETRTELSIIKKRLDNLPSK